MQEGEPAVRRPACGASGHRESVRRQLDEALRGDDPSTTALAHFHLTITGIGAGDRSRSAALAWQAGALALELGMAEVVAHAESRIRDAIARVEAAHPLLGRHLRSAVRTGRTCVYQPEAATRWSA